MQSQTGNLGNEEVLVRKLSCGRLLNIHIQEPMPSAAADELEVRAGTLYENILAWAPQSQSVHLLSNLKKEFGV